MDISKFKIYVDPVRIPLRGYYPLNPKKEFKYLKGNRGNTYLDTGYVFAPKIPYET